jgi:uncharacterized protein YjbI with pentapeptide repeats
MNKTKFFVYIFIALISLTVFLDFKDGSFSYHDILVEFHGLLFDVLFLGIILTIYESFKDKRDKITQYEDDIDDLRGWNSEEAKFKIIGNVKRLYNLGVTKFDLSKCYLNEGYLIEYNFTNSSFVFSYLEKASFSRSNLSNCNLTSANINNAFFVETIAHKANFNYADLSYAIITNCDFSYSNLKAVDLKGAKICASDFNFADMSNTNLENVHVYNPNWLENLKLKNVKGIDKILEVYQIDSSNFDKDEIGEYWIVTKKPTHNNVYN